MRLLLDENLPKRLKLDFLDYEIFTVHDMDWKGIKNGELLKLMLANDFQALLTFDKNLRYQQNFEKYPITVFILNAKINSYQELTKLSSIVSSFLELDNMPIGPVVIQLD